MKMYGNQRLMLGVIAYCSFLYFFEQGFLLSLHSWIWLGRLTGGLPSLLLSLTPQIWISRCVLPLDDLIVGDGDLNSSFPALLMKPSP